MERNVQQIGNLNLDGILRIKEQTNVPNLEPGFGVIYVKADDGTGNQGLAFRYANDSGTVEMNIGGDGAQENIENGGSTSGGKSGAYVPVRVATLGAINLLDAPTTIDGVTLVDGDRVLVKDQTIASENGIYTVSLSTSVFLIRASDMNEDTEFFVGATTLVKEGTIYRGSSFTLISGETLAQNKVFQTAPRGSYYQCRVSSQGNVNLGSPPTTVDGITLVDDDRVLVRSQDTASENGIYIVNGGSWSRAGDLDGEEDLFLGSTVVAGTTLYVHTSGNLAAGMVFTKVNNGTYSSVRTVTVGNVNLGSPPTVVNGITLVQGDRVLVRLQTTASENGVYVVGSSTWERASDMSTDDDLVIGSSIWSTEGDVYSYKVFHHASGNTIAGPKEFVTAVVEYAPVVVASATGENVGLVAVSTVDGITVNEGDRVLLKDQTAPAENGIYVATGGAYVRAGDMAVDQQLVPGTSVFVTGGSTNADKLYIFKSGTIATDKTFVELSGGGGGGFVPEDSLPEEAAVYDIDSQTGLQFWFKANFGVDGPAYSGRNFVTKWYDQSDSGFEFSAPRNNIAPKFVTRDDSHDAVRFDHTTRNNQGSQMSVNTSAFARPNTLFVVFSIKSAVAEGYLLSSSDSVTNHTIKVNAGGLVLDVEGITMPAVTADQLNVMTIVFNDAPTETKVYLNNMTIPSGDQATVAGSLNGMTLGVNPVTGNSDGISADVAEIMFYNVGMGFENRAEVMCYLATKHGIMLQDGLLGWYKSNSGVTTSGGRVTEWANQVCNTSIGNMTVDAGATQGPLFVASNPDALNQPTLSFAGATDGLSVDFGSNDDAVPNTILIVFNTATDDATSDGRMMSSNDSATNHNVNVDTVNKEFTIGTQVGSTIVDYEMPNEMTDFHLLNIHFASGTDAFAYLDSFMIKHFEGVSTATTPLTGLVLGKDGNANGFNGNICEIMVYSDASTTFNSTLGLVTITKYLSQKYGVKLDPISLALDAKYEAGLLDPTQVVLGDPEPLNAGPKGAIAHRYGKFQYSYGDNMLWMKDNYILHTSPAGRRFAQNENSYYFIYEVILSKYDDAGNQIAQSNVVEISEFSANGNNGYAKCFMSRLADSTAMLSINGIKTSATGYLQSPNDYLLCIDFSNMNLEIKFLVNTNNSFSESSSVLLNRTICKLNTNGTLYSVMPRSFAKVSTHSVAYGAENQRTSTGYIGNGFQVDSGHFQDTSNINYNTRLFKIDNNHVLAFFSGFNSPSYYLYTNTAHLNDLGTAFTFITSNTIELYSHTGSYPTSFGAIVEIVPGSKWMYYQQTGRILTLNDVSPTVPNYEVVSTTFTTISGFNRYFVEMFSETEGIMICNNSGSIYYYWLTINGTTVTHGPQNILFNFSTGSTNNYYSASKLNSNTVIVYVADATTDTNSTLDPTRVYVIDRQRRITQWSDQEVNVEIDGDTNDHLIAGGSAFEPIVYRSGAIRLDSTSRQLSRSLGSEEIERPFSTVFVMKVNEAPTGNAILLGNTAVIEIADSTKSLQVNGVELYDNSEYQVNTVVWEDGNTYVFQNSVTSGVDVGDTGSANLEAIVLGDGTAANVDIKEFQVYQGNVMDDANVVVNLSNTYGIELDKLFSFDSTTSITIDNTSMPAFSNPFPSAGSDNSTYDFDGSSRPHFVMLDTETCVYASGDYLYLLSTPGVTPTPTGTRGGLFYQFNTTTNGHHTPYLVKINESEVLLVSDLTSSGEAYRTPVITRFTFLRDETTGKIITANDYSRMTPYVIKYNLGLALTTGVVYMGNNLVLMSYIIENEVSGYNNDCSTHIVLVELKPNGPTIHHDYVVDARFFDGLGNRNQYDFKSIIKLDDTAAIMHCTNSDSEFLEYFLVTINTSIMKFSVAKIQVGSSLLGVSLNVTTPTQHRLLKIGDYIAHFFRDSVSNNRMILYKIHGYSIDYVNTTTVSTTGGHNFNVVENNGIIIYTEFNSSNVHTFRLIRINADETVSVSGVLTPFSQSVLSGEYPQLVVIDDQRMLVHSPVNSSSGAVRIVDIDWKVEAWDVLATTGSDPSYRDGGVYFSSNQQLRHTLSTQMAAPFSLVFSGKLNNTDASDTCLIDTGSNKISVTANTYQLKIDSEACELLNGNVVVCIVCDAADTKVYVNSTNIYTTVTAMGNITDLCLGRSIDSSQMAADFAFYDFDVYQKAINPTQILPAMFTKHSVADNRLYNFDASLTVSSLSNSITSVVKTLSSSVTSQQTLSSDVKYGKVVTTYYNTNSDLRAFVGDIDSDFNITNLISSTISTSTIQTNDRTNVFWVDSTHFVHFITRQGGTSGVGTFEVRLCSIDGSNAVTVETSFDANSYTGSTSSNIIYLATFGKIVQTKSNEFVVLLTRDYNYNTSHQSNSVIRVAKIAVNIETSDIFVKGATNAIDNRYGRSDAQVIPYQAFDYRNNKMLLIQDPNLELPSTQNNYVYYYEVDDNMNITKTSHIDLGIISAKYSATYYITYGVGFMTDTRFAVTTQRYDPNIGNHMLIAIYDIIGGIPVNIQNLSSNMGGAAEAYIIEPINENEFYIIYSNNGTSLNKVSLTNHTVTNVSNSLGNDSPNFNSRTKFITPTLMTRTYTNGSNLHLAFFTLKNPVSTLGVLTSANVDVSPHYGDNELTFYNDDQVLEANVAPFSIDSPYTVFLVGKAAGTSSNLNILNDISIDGTVLSIGDGSFDVGTETHVVAAVIDTAGTGRVYNNDLVSTNITGGSASIEELQIGPAAYTMKTVEYYKGNMSDSEVVNKIIELSNQYKIPMNLLSWYDYDTATRSNQLSILQKDITGIDHDFNLIAVRQINRYKRALFYQNLVDTNYYIRVVEDTKADIVSNFNTLTGETGFTVNEGGLKVFNDKKLMFSIVRTGGSVMAGTINVGESSITIGDTNTFSTVAIQTAITKRHSAMIVFITRNNGGTDDIEVRYLHEDASVYFTDYLTVNENFSTVGNCDVHATIDRVYYIDRNSSGTAYTYNYKYISERDDLGVDGISSVVNVKILGFHDNNIVWVYGRSSDINLQNGTSDGRGKTDTFFNVFSISGPMDYTSFGGRNICITAFNGVQFDIVLTKRTNVQNIIYSRFTLPITGNAPSGNVRLISIDDKDIFEIHYKESTTNDYKYVRFSLSSELASLDDQVGSNDLDVDTEGPYAKDREVVFSDISQSISGTVSLTLPITVAAITRVKGDGNIIVFDNGDTVSSLDGNISVGGVSVNNEDYKIIAFTLNNTNTGMFYDGWYDNTSSVAQSAIGTITNIKVGEGVFDLKALYIYNGVLTANKTQNVFKYLSEKYGIYPHSKYWIEPVSKNVNPLLEFKTYDQVSPNNDRGVTSYSTIATPPSSNYLSETSDHYFDVDSDQLYLVYKDSNNTYINFREYSVTENRCHQWPHKIIQSGIGNGSFWSGFSMDKMDHNRYIVTIYNHNNYYIYAYVYDTDIVSGTLIASNSLFVNYQYPHQTRVFATGSKTFVVFIAPSQGAYVGVRYCYGQVTSGGSINFSSITDITPTPSYGTGYDLHTMKIHRHKNSHMATERLGASGSIRTFYMIKQNTGSGFIDIYNLNYLGTAPYSASSTLVSQTNSISLGGVTNTVDILFTSWNTWILGWGTSSGVSIRMYTNTFANFEDATIDQNGSFFNQSSSIDLFEWDETTIILCASNRQNTSQQALLYLIRIGPETKCEVIDQILMPTAHDSSQQAYKKGVKMYKKGEFLYCIFSGNYAYQYHNFASIRIQNSTTFVKMNDEVYDRHYGETGTNTFVQQYMKLSRPVVENNSLVFNKLLDNPRDTLSYDSPVTIPGSVTIVVQLISQQNAAASNVFNDYITYNNTIFINGDDTGISRTDKIIIHTGIDDTGTTLAYINDTNTSYVVSQWNGGAMDRMVFGNSLRSDIVNTNCPYMRFYEFVHHDSILSAETVDYIMTQLKAKHNIA